MTFTIRGDLAHSRLVALPDMWSLQASFHVSRRVYQDMMVR